LTESFTVHPFYACYFLRLLRDNLLAHSSVRALNIKAYLQRSCNILAPGITDIRQAISINENLEEAAELTRKAFIKEELENVKRRVFFFAKL